MIGISDTATLTLRKILGNGVTYAVPKFQRDYSWYTENWDDFWQDIENLYKNIEKAHYMGYLVFQTFDNKAYAIIDGQQRITTISILIMTALKRLKDLEEENIEPENNKKRREQLQNMYIGYLDPVTLIASNKLTLNHNNNDFYKRYMIPLEEFPKRGLNSSEKLMKSCFDWYYQKILNFNDGSEIAKFVDTIADKLFFTVITVNDELNAYKVFETLNARGVQLSSADLLKNYLFSVVDPNTNNKKGQELNELETLWTNIVSKLGVEKIQDFLRYYWNSKNKTVRKNELFKAMKNNIKTKKEVFSFLRDVLKKADVYVALLNPYDEFWLVVRDKDGVEYKNKIVKALTELTLFGAKQPLSLLISGYSNLSIKEFIKLVECIAVIYFRYNIIGGLNPNDEENVFNNLAIKINDSKKFDRQVLKEIYHPDELFKPDFSNIELKNTSRNRKIIKYILTNIENFETNTKYDITDEQNTIEHILPENPDESWGLEDGLAERYIYRLGNLALLEKNKNKDIQNLPYFKKREVFASSSFKTTKDIADIYSDWTIDNIVKRQGTMAKKAVNIWKIDF